MESSINSVLFDLSEVFLLGLIEARKRISGVTGISVDELHEHMRGDNLKNILELFEGKISEDEYWQGVIARGNYALPIEFLKAYTRSSFNPMADFEHSISILEKLKQKGYFIGLLSDHAKEWVEYIEKHNAFLQLFDGRCYSFQAGYTKMNIKSFEYALATLKFDSNTTLFIDDNPNNIIVAKKAGIKYTHRFEGAKTLEDELIKMNVIYFLP